MTKAKQSHDEPLIEQVCTLLKRVQRWKWRNTSALAAELKVDEKHLLEVLIQEASRTNRRVRYHPLPSGRCMDILWGLVERVGKIPEAPAIQRTDVPLAVEEQSIDLDAPMIFLSHNHRDFAAVAAIRAELAQNKLNGWLFETHIEFNEMIIPAVRQALQDCQALLVFISKHSIGSLWVQKEFRYLLYEMEMPTLVVFNGDDVAFLRTISSHDFAAFQKYAENAVADLHIDDPDQWSRIANEFYHQLHDYLHKSGDVSIYANTEKKQVFPANQLTIAQWAAKIKQSLKDKK